MQSRNRVVPRWRLVVTGVAVAVAVLAVPGRQLVPAASYAESRIDTLRDQPAFYIPTTISQQWQDALKTWTGPTDETFPAPDDIDGWRQLQREGDRFIGRM